MNRRKWRMSDRRHFDIVEANQVYVLQDPNSEFNRSLQNTEGHGVVSGEDGSDVTPIREQLARNVVSALECMPSMQDKQAGFAAWSLNILQKFLAGVERLP